MTKRTVLGGWWPAAIATAGTTMVLAASAGGCLAIADVGDIEYGTTGGGTATGGGGGAAPTCTDGEMNGDETGVDCGGPDCDPCSENCTNGEDDDGNSLVDCADPLCSGYQCVPAAPDGWSGPVALFTGADDATLPACSAGWPTRRTGGSGSLSAPDAECSACSCGAPTGATCEPPRLVFYDSDDCSGVAVLDQVLQANPGECEDFVGSNQDSVVAYPPGVTGGSCASSGGVGTVDPYAWEARHVLCEEAAVGAGCSDASEGCVPAPSAPFATKLCISQSGDASCPAADYTERLLVYTSVADTRDCEACACGEPTGQSCTVTTSVYTNQSCQLSELVVPNDGTTCSNHPGSRGARYSIDAGPSGGQCTASGGSPTGEAIPGNAVTICCQP